MYGQFPEEDESSDDDVLTVGHDEQLRVRGEAGVLSHDHHLDRHLERHLD
jgi:hypothetical protein